MFHIVPAKSRWCIPLWAVGVALLFTVLTAAHAWLNNAAGGAHAACMLKSATGLPCPTCGTTRAGIALLSGRLLDALAHNPLVMVLGVFGISYVAFRVVTGNDVQLRLSRRGQAAAWAAAGIAFAANWMYVIMVDGPWR